MNCAFCNAKISESSEFCTECGEKQIESNTQPLNNHKQPQVVYVQPPSQPTQVIIKKEGGCLGGCLKIVLVFIIIIIILGIFAGSNILNFLGF